MNQDPGRVVDSLNDCPYAYPSIVFSLDDFYRVPDPYRAARFISNKILPKEHRFPFRSITCKGLQRFNTRPGAGSLIYRRYSAPGTRLYYVEND